MAMPSPVSLESQAQQELAYAAGCRALAAESVFDDGSTDYEGEDLYLTQAEISEKHAARLLAEVEAFYQEIEARFPPPRKNRRVPLCE